MYPKTEPLPRYRKQFDRLSLTQKDIIIKVQIKFPSYWWNPVCNCKCLKHKKIHKYSFESYVEGWVRGYFGADSLLELKKMIEKEIQ